MSVNSVLILEDNSLVRQVMVKIAHACGFDAEAAATPEEFYAKFCERRATILVLDVVLGNEDVCAVLDFLAARRFGGPIILTSGYHYRILQSVAKLASGRGLLVADLIEKPASSERLVDVLCAHAVRDSESINVPAPTSQ